MPVPAFLPESVTWRVNREGALVLAGGRALLMQLAHPAVAATVATHSQFRRRPLRRLTRTLGLTLAMCFGTPDEAATAARTINGAHRRVGATDPAHLLWVHATLVDSALLAYRTFVGDLPPADAECYYQESKTLGAVLGVPPRYYPGKLDDLRRYVDGMLDGDELVVDERAQRLAHDVLWPPVRAVPTALWHPSAALAAGLLPARLRAAYGLPLGRAERAVLALVRLTAPRLPLWLRSTPPARRALRRISRQSRAVRQSPVSD